MTNIDDFRRGTALVSLATTGLDPAVDEVCGLAFAAWGGAGWQYETKVYRTRKANNPKYNGITEEMQANAPPFDPAELNMLASVAVGHNTGFIRQWADEAVPGADWLCTLRLARQIWPDAPSFALDRLCANRELTTDRSVTLEANIVRTAALLEHIIFVMEAHGRIGETDCVAAQLLELQDRRPPLWPFGKYKGKRIDQLPADYLEQAIVEMDVFDPRSASYDPALAAAVAETYQGAAG